MLELPNAQTRTYRSTAVGDNQGGGIGSMALQGTRIRGVSVDNPSGSWVKLTWPSANDAWIPPFTLGWSITLVPSQLEVAAQYVGGPTGQSTSTAGMPITVYLSELPVPNSPGSPFVTPGEKIQSALLTIAAVPTEASVLFIPAAAGKSIRVFYASLTQDQISPADGAGQVYLVDTSLTVYLPKMAVSRTAPFVAFPYPAPVDLPPGEGLAAYARSGLGAVLVQVAAAYVYV